MPLVGPPGTNGRTVRRHEEAQVGQPRCSTTTAGGFFEFFSGEWSVLFFQELESFLNTFVRVTFAVGILTNPGDRHFGGTFGGRIVPSVRRPPVGTSFDLRVGITSAAINFLTVSVMPGSEKLLHGPGPFCFKAITQRG